MAVSPGERTQLARSNPQRNPGLAVPLKVPSSLACLVFALRPSVLLVTRRRPMGHRARPSLPPPPTPPWFGFLWLPAGGLFSPALPPNLPQEVVPSNRERSLSELASRRNFLGPSTGSLQHSLIFTPDSNRGQSGRFWAAPIPSSPHFPTAAPKDLRVVAARTARLFRRPCRARRDTSSPA